MKKIIISLLVFIATLAAAEDYPKQTYVCAAYYWKTQMGSWPENDELQLFGAEDDGKRVELVWKTKLLPKPSAAWIILHQPEALAAWETEIVQAQPKSPEQELAELKAEVAMLKAKVTKLETDVKAVAEP